MTLLGMVRTTGLFVAMVVVLALAASRVLRGCPQRDVILPCKCALRNGEEYQIWCSHSDLSNVLTGITTLARLLTRPVDELIIENNNLPSLPGSFFRSLRIVRLMLRNNGLERIPRGFLTGQEGTLVEVYVVEPKLGIFPEESLGQLKMLEAVTIWSEVIEHFPNLSGLPRLRYLSLQSKSASDLNPEFFRELESLEKFHLSGSRTLKRLQKGLLIELPRLNMINISFCGINWIDPGAMSVLLDLRELHLEGNDIRDAAMVGRAIRYLPNLRVLNLDNNLVKSISEGSFVELSSLVSLRISNNLITEIQKNSFRNMPNFRVLNLNGNRLQRIHPEAFSSQNGNSVEELLLIGNEIAHITELRSVLDGLPRLKFLDLTDNNLETIPYGSIRGHPMLERLHLDHNRLQLIGKEAFFGMPALRELRLKNNSLSDIIRGPLWRLPALKGLDLSHNYYRKVDQHLLSNLPSLRRLDLSRNEIVSIDPMSFLANPALEHVNVSFNSLPILHPAIFRPLVNLYELDVSHNKLGGFISGLPRGIEYLHLRHNRLHIFPHPTSPDFDLPVLKMLDVTGNSIQRIASGALQTASQLRKLYFGDNSLQYLEERTLLGLDRLEILDLHDNRLLRVHVKCFRHIPKLRWLNLSGNSLDTLDARTFNNMTRLQILDLSGNNLKQFDTELFNSNRELEILNLSRNSLIDISEGLYGLKKLRLLDLTDNQISEIVPDSLEALTSLADLKLSHNRLQQLRVNSFTDLKNLRILHLDNNIIETVETRAIHNLPQLVILKLNRNKLQKIPTATFADLPLVQSIELQENRLSSLAVNTFTSVSNLLFLNLSNNYLHSAEAVGHANIKSVELLDLSRNNIVRIEKNSLATLKWVVELRLDENEICALYGTPFDGMPRLRFLSFKNNRIVSISEQALQKLRGNIIVDLEGNPLSCSCHMLWMKTWHRRSFVRDPRCSNGNLLRDMRLSKQECGQYIQSPDPVAPGCEAEFLVAPGTHKIPLMQLKGDNSTTQKKGYPSPEESEYFYDDYIDFPHYNETAILVDKYYYLSGNAPTIYAATSKNKTNLDGAKPANSWRGSSGITFFGVPLPSLNALLGRKFDSTPATERKVAIIAGSTRRPFPSTVPEMQSGGFIPVIPNSGGFRPMLPPKVNFSASVQTSANKSEPAKEPSRLNENNVNIATKETLHEIRSVVSVPELLVKPSSTPAPSFSADSVQMNIRTTENHRFAKTETFEGFFNESMHAPPQPTSSYEKALHFNETVHRSTASSKDRKEESSKKPIKEDTQISLTPLLIPGSSTVKHSSGRSTITKVISSHATLPFSSSLKIANSVQNMTDAGAILNTTIDHSSWYFQNYDKTYPEPHVGQNNFYNSGSSVNYSDAGLQSTALRLLKLVMITYICK